MLNVFRFKARVNLLDGRELVNQVVSFVSHENNVKAVEDDVFSSVASLAYDEYGIDDDYRVYVSPVATKINGGWHYVIRYVDYIRSNVAKQDYDVVINPDDFDMELIYVGDRYVVDKNYHYNVCNMPMELQMAAAESLIEHYDVNGHVWHDEADFEQESLAEQLQYGGYKDAKIHSTQSFCCQGDDTCVSFAGLDIDVFWESNSKYFTGKHDYWLLKNLLYVSYDLDWQAHNAPSSDLNIYFNKDSVNIYSWNSLREDHPTLYKALDKIYDVLEDVCKDLDSNAYNAMKSAYDYWYSDQHLVDDWDESESVWYDGNEWQSDSIHKTYRWEW